MQEKERLSLDLPKHKRLKERFKAAVESNGETMISVLTDTMESYCEAYKHKVKGGEKG